MSFLVAVQLLEDLNVAARLVRGVDFPLIIRLRLEPLELGQERRIRAQLTLKFLIGLFGLVIDFVKELVAAGRAKSLNEIELLFWWIGKLHALSLFGLSP